MLWVTIFAVALASAAIKAAGPLLVAGRELPAGTKAVVALLSPALLAALVVTQTLGADGRVAVDERVLGVAVAAAALALRAPVLLAVGLAVAATALSRAFL